MKVAILGGGNVYALNFARYLSSVGIDHFGIGRSGRKSPAFWQIEHHYRYSPLHLGAQLPAVLAVMDTERPDVVVNFAAQGEGAASFGADAHMFYTTNTVALVKLTEELRKRDYVRRFVQIGTSELYGSVEKPSKETDQLKPSSPYAISKAAFDQHLQVMHLVHGFPMNVVRPSNAYCPGQQLHRIIPKAIISARNGTKLELQGGGRAKKSYIHAEDLSRAILAVIEKGRVGQVYNCGPKEPISIRNLVMMVAAAYGIAFEELVNEAPDRVGQDGCYWLDSSSLEAIGWKQIRSFASGILEMFEWVNRHPEILAMDTTYRIRP